MLKITKALESKIEKIFKEEGASKSSKMLSLYSLGFDIKEITEIFEQNNLKVRYNFVYNVVSNYCNINQVELRTSKRENKKDKIIELFLANKSNKEISKELKTNYNYVYKVLKEYKKEAEKKNKEAAEKKNKEVVNK